MGWAAKTKIVVVAAVLTCAATTSALACAPSHGGEASVTGPVLDVPAAGVICVALGPRPEQWIRVRVAGAEQMERKRLMAAAFSKRVECVLTARGGGICRLAGEDLAAIASSPEISRVADTWR